MALYEKTVYPQLMATFAADELERYFTPTAEELEFANKGARSNGSRLILLTLLKLFQMLHRFPASGEVPAAVVQHIRIHLGIGCEREHTLEEIGQEFDVTRERIRQIEAKALRQLRAPERARRLRALMAAR